MSYQYSKERERLFTDEGQKMFLAIRDKAFELDKLAGCFRAQEAMNAACGSTWQQIACLDRMVELGEIVEVTKLDECWGQHRIFRRRRAEA